MSDTVTVSGGGSSGGSGGGCGCFSLIMFVLLMWALIFGVTLENRHYSIGCSWDSCFARTPKAPEQSSGLDRGVSFDSTSNAEINIKARLLFGLNPASFLL